MSEEELVSLSKTSLEILLAEAVQLRDLYAMVKRLVGDSLDPNQLRQGSINWDKLDHNRAAREARIALGEPVPDTEY